MVQTKQYVLIIIIDFMEELTKNLKREEWTSYIRMVVEVSFIFTSLLLRKNKSDCLYDWMDIYVSKTRRKTDYKIFSSNRMNSDY